ncbi:MAG: DEAD/DEAH box helicase [Clostridia bacterium]
MEEMFDIEKFNIISDEENYYFFRSLEPGDIKDLEEGNIKDENGKYIRLRTDRERWEETHSIKPRWNAESTVTLEEMYNHIKIHYSLETNCISLSSNANVARTYGETFSDKYVMIKVPKNEMGQRVYNAGQYMLAEIDKKVQERISQGNIPEEVLEDFRRIDETTESKELKEIIKVKYTAPEGIDISKSGMKKGIVYKAPLARVSSFQALDDEQTLEKNKIVAKLTILEQKGLMGPAVPRIKTNSELIKTLGSAFASGEQIYYGDIEGNRVTDISKELLDMFALIQQAESQDKEVVNELKTELVKYIINGGKLEVPEGSILRDDGTPKDDISIEEMYQITEGKVEYGQASSIVKNMYYLSKGQANARILAGMLRKITGNNPKYEEIIKYIENNGFEIEPKITARKSNKGYRISESVNLDLKPNEIGLVDSIRNLTDEEQMQIIQDRGLSNVRDIMNTSFAQMQTVQQISKEDYFASAIVDTYDWDKINVEELSITERNELIQKLKQSNCVSIYEKLKEAGIENKDIPTAVINIASKGNLKGILESENYIEQIQNNIEEITQGLSIEQVERYLGYYDVKGTGISLRDYQQDAVDKAEEIYKEKRYASIILPTGGGKTYVALTEMLQYGKTAEEIAIEENQIELGKIAYKTNNKKMLYLAPSNEILEQTKDRIIENIHGKIGTSGKSKDKIIADVFKNLQFATYQSLITKAGKETLKKQYDFIIFDELHRTGAEKWEEALNKLLENQLETTKVLGITATPRRDADDRNMADEIAEKLGYTYEERQENKHIAAKIELKEAIQLGMVVNPKVVSCEYNLLTDGSMENLAEQINEIEDENERKKKLEQYDRLRKNLEKAKGIPEILQENLKEGGKYIVFIPVGGNEEGKDSIDKVKEWEKQISEYLKNSGIEPEYYSMLSAYSDKENERQLEGFESEKSDKTKFMIVMNKLNEGVHVDGVNGILWFRPLDENSKILYKQQIGRVITSVDPDNPPKDEDRPVVMDFANNTERVEIDKEIKSNNRKNDLELLTIVVDWVKSHGDNLPQVTSTSNQERRYAATLYRIQQKYIEYRNGIDIDNEGITEDERNNIESIIAKGEEIELWDIELEKITKEESDKILEVDSFELKGNLHDFVELEKEVKDINYRKTALKNIIEIEKWCKEQFEGKPEYSRRIPRTDIKGIMAVKEGEEETEEQREIRLGRALSNFKRSAIWKNYQEGKEQGLSREEIKQKYGMREGEIALVERYERVIEEYNYGGLNIQADNIIEIEKWCKEQFEGKPEYSRRIPRSKIRGIRAVKEGEEETEEQRELRLGQALNTFKQSTIWKNYQEGKEKGLSREEIKQEYGMREGEIVLVERYERLIEEYDIDTNLKNIMEIEEWCKEQFEGKPEYSRRIPRGNIKGIIASKEGEETEEQREIRLGRALHTFKQSTIWKNYQEEKEKGLSREEIKQEYGMREGEIALVERYERLIEEYDIDTNLKNIMEIEEWCKEKNEEKPEYSRRTPRANIKGIMAAKEGEEETEEQREVRLGQALKNFKQKSTIWENYQEGKEKGLSREEIKQEYGMREGEIALVERYERIIEEYDLGTNLKNIMEIEEWCKEQFEGKPEYSRRTPRTGIKGIMAVKEGEEETEEQRELRLGKALSKFKQSTIRKNYQEGKEKGLSREEIKQEYGMREGEIALVERYERVIEEYGVKKELTGQSIGQASYTATAQECDEAQADLNKLIQEQQEITQKD